MWSELLVDNGISVAIVEHRSAMYVSVIITVYETMSKTYYKVGYLENQTTVDSAERLLNRTKEKWHG